MTRTAPATSPLLATVAAVALALALAWLPAAAAQGQADPDASSRCTDPDAAAPPDPDPESVPVVLPPVAHVEPSPEQALAEAADDAEETAQDSTKGATPAVGDPPSENAVDAECEPPAGGLPEGPLEGELEGPSANATLPEEGPAVPPEAPAPAEESPPEEPRPAPAEPAAAWTEDAAPDAPAPAVPECACAPAPAPAAPAAALVPATRGAAQGSALAEATPPAAVALVGLLLWRVAALLLARRSADPPAPHPRAQALLDAVCARPGLSLRGLRAATGLANGVALHHLATLLRQGRVVAHRHRNTVRFFENHGRYAASWRQAAVLRDDANRRLLAWLAAHPGARQRDVVAGGAGWGWRRGVTQKRLALLAEAGLLVGRRAGREVRYEAVAPAAALPDDLRGDWPAWPGQAAQPS